MKLPNLDHTIKAIIFDLDGTLVSTDLNFNAIRDKIGCPQGSDILGFIETMACEHQQQQATEAVIDFEIMDAQQSEWILGAQSFVTSLIEHKYPTAIVTRNCRRASLVKLETNNIPINYLVTREDAPAKPDPTALLQIADEWRISPQHIAYVGDYIYDIQAANNAGMASLFYCPTEKPDYAEQADYTFQSFTELTPYIK